MFKIEIHGYFKEVPSKRESSNLDYTVYGESLNNYCFMVPDNIKATDKKYIVVSFSRKDFSPYLPYNMFSYFLDKLIDFKDKILIDLYFYCLDINLTTGERNIISLNQATMDSFTYQSKIFYNDTDDVFYYTYEKEGLHIVWIENTETILNKVRLMERKGYNGIFIRDFPLALEGNWEAIHSLYRMKKD